MKNFRLSPLANEDLQQIIAYHSERSPKYARKISKQILERCRLQARQPGLGKPRGDLRNDYRSAVVDPHLIFFQQTQYGVFVLRVIHGSQDYGPQDFKGLDSF